MGRSHLRGLDATEYGGVGIMAGSYAANPCHSGAYNVALNWRTLAADLKTSLMTVGVPVQVWIKSSHIYLPPMVPPTSCHTIHISLG